MRALTFAQYGRSWWSAYDNGRFVAMGRTKREAKAKALAGDSPVTNEYPTDAQPYSGEVNRG